VFSVHINKIADVSPDVWISLEALSNNVMKNFDIEIELILLMVCYQNDLFFYFNSLMSTLHKTKVSWRKTMQSFSIGDSRIQSKKCI